MNVKQISVFLENRPGQLAQITGKLADNHVDLRAISIAETTDYGVLRLLVDDTERAARILLEDGHILTLTPVTVVGVKDEPAALSKLLGKLASTQIEYMYSLFTHPGGKAYMVFRASDNHAFQATLAEHGIVPVSSEELGLK